MYNIIIYIKYIFEYRILCVANNCILGVGIITVYMINL